MWGLGLEGYLGRLGLDLLGIGWGRGDTRANMGIGLSGIGGGRGVMGYCREHGD